MGPKVLTGITRALEEEFDYPEQTAEDNAWLYYDNRRIGQGNVGKSHTEQRAPNLKPKVLLDDYHIR